MPRLVDSGLSSLRGSETPRIFTPPARELTPETSRGFACIAFAEDILEIRLHPWQRWLLIHALEVNPDGAYRFRTVVLLVARQNGKSTLMLVLALWRMYVDGAPLVIGTAQNLDISEEMWTAAVEMAESIPELAALIDHVDKTNGKKALRLESGERYKVAAASRRGGRGLSGDLVLLDELREHKTWEAWGAVTKTTMARPAAQVWAASNAGDLASVVLRHLRSIAHRSLGWPDGQDGMVDVGDGTAEGGDSVGIFEWSAKPGRDVWDRDGWAEANPSLGHSITETAVAAAAATDPEPVFRTEVLCQFVNQLVTGPIPGEVWERNRAPKDTTPRRPRVAVEHRTGFEQSLSIVAAYEVDTPKGRRDVVDVGYYESGVDVTWPAHHVVEKVTSTLAGLDVTEVVIDDHGDGNALLAPMLEQAGIRVIRIRVGEARSAAVGFVDGNLNGRILHIDGQDPLTVAVVGARTSPSQDGFLWSQAKSDVDLGPLRAACAAWWVLHSTRSADYDLLDSFA